MSSAVSKYASGPLSPAGASLKDPKRVKGGPQEADCEEPAGDTKGDYVLVPKSAAAAAGILVPASPAGRNLMAPGEAKTISLGEPVRIGRLIQATRQGARSGGPVKVKLWQKISQSQATTALVTASALQPSSGLGFNTFADVYDEVRCTKIEFVVRAIDGNLPGVASWAVCFDPSASGNLSSVIVVLEHRWSVGPIALSSGASAGPTTAVASSTGYHRFGGVPQKLFQSSVTNDLIGSNWYPSTTTSSIVGYLKPYVENSSGGTVYLTSFVAYHCEFRCRG